MSVKVHSQLKILKLRRKGFQNFGRFNNSWLINFVALKNIIFLQQSIKGKQWFLNENYSWNENGFLLELFSNCFINPFSLRRIFSCLVKHLNVQFLQILTIRDKTHNSHRYRILMVGGTWGFSVFGKFWIVGILEVVKNLEGLNFSIPLLVTL